MAGPSSVKVYELDVSQSKWGMGMGNNNNNNNTEKEERSPEDLYDGMGATGSRPPPPSVCAIVFFFLFLFGFLTPSSSSFSSIDYRCIYLQDCKPPFPSSPPAATAVVGVCLGEAAASAQETSDRSAHTSHTRVPRLGAHLHTNTNAHAHSAALERRRGCCCCYR